MDYVWNVKNVALETDCMAVNSVPLGIRIANAEISCQKLDVFTLRKLLLSSFGLTKSMFKEFG